MIAISIIQGLSRKRLFAHHSLNSPLCFRGRQSSWNENVALDQNISLKVLKKCAIKIWQPIRSMTFMRQPLLNSLQSYKNNLKLFVHAKICKT